MGKKAEPTIGGGVAAVDRRESEKGGMNQFLFALYFVESPDYTRLRVLAWQTLRL